MQTDLHKPTKYNFYWFLISDAITKVFDWMMCFNSKNNKTGFAVAVQVRSQDFLETV